MRAVLILRADHDPQIYLKQKKAEMEEAGGDRMIKLGTNCEKINKP